MPIDIKSSYRDDITNLVVDHIDDGASAGYIQVRTGARPANCEAANSGTLLGTLTFSDPAFGNSSSGQATANAITSDTNADATGTAGHFRVFDSNNVCIFQGDCGQGTGTMNFDNTSIVAGGTIAISSFTFTTPLTGA
jgi:hypothetical protein